MFTEKDVEKVIQNLDSNKAHGHDMTSIHMHKAFDKVWPQGLHCKQSNGTSGKRFKTLTDFLDNRTINIPHGLRLKLDFPKVQFLGYYCS